MWNKRELELTEVLESLGYKISLCEPNDPYLKGAGGWHSNSKKEIAIGNYKSNYKEMVLWHEATHAAQYCYGNGSTFKVLGFQPTEVGQEDWLCDRSWYKDSIRDWDIEREARYVEHSKANQEILLSILKRMADPANLRYLHPCMVSEVSTIEYKPSTRFNKITCLLCSLVFCMGILNPSTTPKVESQLDASTPACTQVSYDNGEC
jgi:hypothetical protein